MSATRRLKPWNEAYYWRGSFGKIGKDKDTNIYDGCNLNFWGDSSMYTDVASGKAVAAANQQGSVGGTPFVVAPSIAVPGGDRAKARMGQYAVLDSTNAFGLMQTARCDGSTGREASQLTPTTPAPHKDPFSSTVSTWTELGSDPVECPSSTCEYTYHTQRKVWNKMEGYSVSTLWANKTKWDEEYRTPCCLGLLTTRRNGDALKAVTSITAGNNGTMDCNTYCAINKGTEVGGASQCFFAEDASGNEVACDATTPGKLIKCHCAPPVEVGVALGDPNLLCGPGITADSCASALSATCTTLDKDGTPLLAKEGHACNDWYQEMSGKTGPGQVQLDEMVTKVCTASPGLDCCSCYERTTCQHGGCVAYTSLTGGGVVSVTVNSSLNNSPENLVDPRCVNGSCLTDPTQLMTYATRQILNGCPSVCWQAIEGAFVDLDDVKANGVYIADQTMECTSGSIAKTDPVIQQPTSLMVPVAVNDQGQIEWYQSFVAVNNISSGASSFDATFELRGGPEGTTVNPLKATLTPDGNTRVTVDPQRTTETMSPGETRTAVLVTKDSDGNEKGKTLLTFYCTREEFDPPSPFCAGDSCSKGSVVIVDKVEPSLTAWVILILSAVVFAACAVAVLVTYFGAGTLPATSLSGDPDNSLSVKSKQDG